MKYIEYYPLVLREIYEIQIISNILDKFLNEFEENKNNLISELYLSTATGVGLEIWENVLDIEVTDTSADVRRFKIRSKLLGDNTSLRTKLDTLIGKDKYRISIDLINCHVIFNLELSAQNLKNAVAELLEKVLPLNLTYEINLAYNKHTDLASYQHRELNNYTHKELNAKKLR